MKNRLQRPEPKIVARYNDYEVTHGVTHGMYYVCKGKDYVGHKPVYANAISLISLREGQGFDINKVEDLR